MRRSWPDIPEVAIWPWPSGSELHVRIEPRASTPADETADAEWVRQCAANPRLFDGPILSIAGLSPGSEIRARRESYKRLSVQPAVDTGVEQLSVTGIVLASDDAGAEHVLMGRRAADTRIYGGLWELGPSGGVDPPAGRLSLCEGDLLEQLQRELNEETGLSTRLRDVRIDALCQDLAARSCDIVLVCRVPDMEDFALPASKTRWEYGEVCWVPLREMRRFDAENDLIPPSRALLRHLGWV